MGIIVIEGADGAGKSTQIELLINYFKKNEIKYKFIHFPVMEDSFSGKTISKFLRGEFGGVKEVNPYFVSILYAMNRNEYKDQILNWIKNGYTILLDRYVYSNIAFQCAKIKDKNKKEELKKWLLEMEFEYYNLPKPNLTIYLDVPENILIKRLNSKRSGEDRNYLNGSEDIHEKDFELQKNVINEYLMLVKEDDTFYKVETYEKDKHLTPHEIYEKIIKIIKSAN
ncbi:thymidylate kinase [Tepiditoga spiralis]|uniref:Thymidylate kinase n=1 Tax=Tepiditoga spiralis TaxID=2108365 RepID=A0A7G1G298_9BACT|nr:dTMP kinase [Tepiditoga spiralis]BBE30470.1 thymidylate kinase [Tepiditoga spiralis]